MGVAADPSLLALADQGGSLPKTNLLFAAVHYLLLQGISHALSRFYPTVTPGVTPPDDPYPYFRDFCLAHGKDIVPLLKTRRVQTNEVARSAFLHPAFSYLAGRTGTPLAAVEVGTSAGLLLAWDRYHLDYGAAGQGGDLSSPVHILCEVKGSRRLPLAQPAPAVRFRAGIDLHPIDVKNPEEALWLRALVWGDQPERAERLGLAIGCAAPYLPTLTQGDAAEALPGILEQLPERGVSRVVFHCHTLNQFTPEARQGFTDLLCRQSGQADLFQLSLEAAPGLDYPEMRLLRYARGAKAEEALLARYHAHGDWIEWLA